MSRKVIWMFVEVESGNSHTDIFAIIGKQPIWILYNFSTFYPSFILTQSIISSSHAHDDDNGDDDDDDDYNDDDGDDGYGSKQLER